MAMKAAAVLLLLSLAAATYAVNVVPTPEAVCRTAWYPAPCLKLIETYHPTSLQALMEAAFRDITARLKVAKVKCEALNRKLGNGTSDGMNTFSCSTAYDSAAYELEHQGVYAAISAGHSSDVITYGSGISSSISICYDIFDVNTEFDGKMVFPGSRIYRSLHRRAMNIMTVICAVYPGQCY